MAAGALVRVGLERRASRDDAAAAEAGRRSRQLLVSADFTSDPSADLSRLRAARAAAASIRLTPEATPALLAVLNSWPAQAAASVQTLSITGGAATLSLSVEGDPAPLLNAIAAPRGWTIDEPRINRSASVARVVLMFRPSSANDERASAGAAP